ncbi:MAG: ATP-binding protein [Halioglobus sp.]|nr:ATP-binding protein [Halioglobus sp.]
MSRKSLIKITEAGVAKGEVAMQSRQHQREATESQKLAAVGQLTGGLAHDFNNILGIVVGNLDEVQESLPPGFDKIQSQIDSALAAALAGVEVSRGLLAVARREKNDVQACDVNTLIDDIMPMIKSAAGSNVIVRSQLSVPKLICNMRGSGLDNIMLNLVINARDAMRSVVGNRFLTLRTKAVNVQSGFDNKLVSGLHALIEVSDTGVGMDEALLEQIFKPFFTTKDEREGTGLGLSMVSRYVEEAGGVVHVKSTEGAGTSVRLYLPLDKVNSDASGPEVARHVGLSPYQLSVADVWDAGLDSLASDAARISRVPAALMFMADENRQLLKASVGAESYDSSVLQHARSFFPTNKNTEQVLVVPDIRLDPRFSQSPLLIAEPPAYFYAEAPIVDASGHTVGALCVVDHAPNTLINWQVEGLQTLAEAAMSIFIRSRRSESVRTKHAADTVTGIATSAQRKTDISSVLVVDDEVALCELSAIWLTSLGCKVTIAHSAAEALEHLAHKRYAILFTDIVMPGGMDGVELAKKALLLQAHLKVLMTSGYADRLAEDEELPGELISKPYRKIDLINAISRL